MKAQQKTYRKAQLNLSLNIAKKFLDSCNIKLDPNIERAVLLLNYFGFSTYLSCEGHVSPYKGVNTFRLFWPYIQVTLSQRKVFHLTGKDLRMETIAENPVEMLRRLEFLVSEFTCTIHPFNGKKGEPHELSVISRNGSITEPEHVLQIMHAIEKHWNYHVMICDVGVQGILTMPQEMLNDAFRKKFLARTQREMELFTKFLEWYAIEEGVEALEL